VGSVRFDLPAAPSILVALASLLVAFGIVLSVAARRRRAPLSAGESF
jgi:hypothetical protein